MDWILINTIGLVCLLVLMVVLLWVNHSKSNKVRDSFEQQCLQTQQQIEQLQIRLESIEKSAIAWQQKIAKVQANQPIFQQALEQLMHRQGDVDPKLVELEQQLQAHANALQLIQSESTEHKLYGRAKKMIEMGADVDELISECDVPRAEAELLMSLYKQAQ